MKNKTPITQIPVPMATPPGMYEYTRERTSTFRMLTPAEAIFLLMFCNPYNRRKKVAMVNEYLGQMRDGSWMTNGETIVLDWNGSLQDGQHRLHAIKEYGKPVEVLFVTGIDPAAFATQDTGGTRTPVTVLEIEGFDTPKAKALAAAVKLTIALENGVNYFSIPAALNYEMTPIKISRIVEADPSFSESFDAVAAMAPRKNMLLSLGASTFLYRAMLLREKQANRVGFTAPWFKGLLSGEELEKGSRLILRKVIEGAIIKRTLLKKPYTDNVKMAMVAKAWWKDLSNNTITSPGPFTRHINTPAIWLRLDEHGKDNLKLATARQRSIEL